NSKEFGSVKLVHETLGEYFYYFDGTDKKLFTENETNFEKLWGGINNSPHVKDLFHSAVIEDRIEAFTNLKAGTKFSPVYQVKLKGKEKIEIKLRLSKAQHSKNPLLKTFDSIFSERMVEADEFYNTIITKDKSEDEKKVQRQAFAGMLWSKQYYNIDIPLWLNGDKGSVAPPIERKTGRNSGWHTLNNEDIISMPDKWEYPWYAAWDLAFHCIPIAMVDSQFAKDQLLLFLREWYMHPNGQIPAYEWAFGDVNPPVHAMSCLKVYYIDKDKNKGNGDVDFLKKAFLKLSLNFTWWVNRKDTNGKNVFEGGFLGLDNIGVFDRSSAIPGGGHLEQADGTSWMAMYSLNMLEMALELTKYDKSFEQMATKFFEHFVLIAESLNRISKDWTGAWDEKEGFFYDILVLPNHNYIPVRVRSLVGLTTLFATYTVSKDVFKQAPEFISRLSWFKEYVQKQKDYTIFEEFSEDKILFSLLPKDRLTKLLHAMLDEEEFLSEFGIRALSKKHLQGYGVHIEDNYFGLQYEPAESSSNLFGGNSNWRGPIWMPMNYMIIDSLRKFHAYYGDALKVECPTGSGNFMNLKQVSENLKDRLANLFKMDNQNNRPINGLTQEIYQRDEFKDLILFYEYFHGDNGRGVGATHQTGWTGVIAALMNDL
ncbi:MAG: MGH1-like glycoside hydrolase domain-containing protein, partial [Cytophagales bacterium]